MSGVELADDQTYSPTLSNLGLRTLGYQLPQSDKYSSMWSQAVSEFCGKRDRIETLADRVAVTVFGHLFEQDGHGPESKDEAEPFAQMILDEDRWEDKLLEMMSWYLPTGRRELFNALKVDNVKRYEIPVQSDTNVDPYDKPLDEESFGESFEAIQVDLNRYCGQTTLGSEYPTDPTLPRLGVELAKQMNDVYARCGSLQPNYDEDEMVEHPTELLDEIYEAGHEPDLMLVSNRKHSRVDGLPELRTVEDNYLAPCEFIIVDTDRFGYRVVESEWDVDTLSGIEMSSGPIRDLDSTLKFRMKSRQGIGIANEDAAVRGLCRP